MHPDKLFRRAREKGAAAWQAYQDWSKNQGQLRVDRTFLPAVLEIETTPPSPTARYLLRGLFALLVVALLWSIFGSIDIIAVGEGKIVPTGRVKVVQPLETGVIKALHVEDGQKVKAGDVLVELDLTQTQSDRERLTGEHAMLAGDVRRLQALETDAAMPEWDDLPADIAELETRLFNQTTDKHRAEMGALTEELAQHKSELADAEAQVRRLGASVKLLDGRAARIKKLVDEGFYARNRFDQDEIDRLRQERDLETQRQRAVQAKAAMTATAQKRAGADAEYKRQLLTDLNDRQTRLLNASKDLTKATRRDELQTLRAPIDGTIQELKVHTRGGVVTPAQELMKIVPFEDALEAEVMIPNKDIGFVKPGQPAKIKLEAFPFTKYGLIDGEVKSVSLDAINDEKRGLIYAARVVLKQTRLRVGEKFVPLGAGLALTAEIKTGSRRIIEYFLSPLQEYADESIRER